MHALITRLRRLLATEHLRTLLRGAVLVMAVRVLGAALAYTSHVLLARWMGVFQFGLFIYAWIWVIVPAYLLPLGMSAAVVRFVPEYLTRAAPRRLRGVIAFSRRLTLASGLAYALLGTAVLRLLAPHLPAGHAPPLLLAVWCTPLFALMLLHEGLARSFDRVVLAFSPQYLWRPLGLLLLGGLLYSRGWPLDATLAMQLSILVCGVVLLGQMALFRHGLPATMRRARPVWQGRHWLRIAFPMLLVQGFDLLFLNTDLLVLGVFASPDQVGIYNAAVRTAGLISFVHYAVTSLAAQRFSALATRRDRARIERLLRTSVHLMFWPALAIAAALAMFGPTLLALFGPEFRAGYPTLLILIAGHLANAAVGPLSVLLNMTGHQAHNARIMGATALVNLALNLLLIPLWGIRGAALATVTAMLLTAALLARGVRRRFGFLALPLPRPAMHD